MTEPYGGLQTPLEPGIQGQGAWFMGDLQTGLRCRLDFDRFDAATTVVNPEPDVERIITIEEAAHERAVVQPPTLGIPFQGEAVKPDTQRSTTVDTHEFDVVAVDPDMIDPVV